MTAIEWQALYIRAMSAQDLLRHDLTAGTDDLTLIDAAIAKATGGEAWLTC